VPIKFEEKVIAWMNVASHTLEEFQEDYRVILEAIANLLGEPLMAAIKRQEYDIFIGTTTDSFAILDLKGRILEVNDAYCRLMGYTREEFLGKSLADIEAKESEEDTRRHIQYIKKNGYDRFFSQLRHKNGSVLDVEISARFLNVRGGMFFAFTRDITAQVEAQKQLEHSEARYRAIVDGQAELICRYDADCRLTFVNEAYCRYFAMTREALLGVDWLTLVPENERASLRRKLAALNPTDPVITYDHRTTLPDGTIRWQEWTESALFDASGRFLEFQSTGRDITERKLAAEARLEAEKDAAAKQALETQRVISIRSDRLRALGEMAAGIAHELNQPLVGVRGLAEHLLLAIKRGWLLDPERVQKKLQGIVDQADRMSHIIQHVRTFSRRSGDTSSTRVNLNDVVAAALELMEAQLRSRGIVVQRRLDASLPEVLANPFSLEEVVLNCLTNARDAIEERAAISNQADSPCLITLRTRTRGRGKGRQVLLDITDTGIGIPPDILEKVFDPFFTTKDPDRGTGLGLSISKSIVDACGGTFALQSRPMSGTTLTVALPVGGVKV
jgi:PAS domain S-box-containing protein